MNKYELLEYIKGLPDDIAVVDCEIRLDHEQPEPASWSPLGDFYQRTEATRLRLSLDLETRCQVTARFKRTYTNPDGSFYDRRVERLDRFRCPL